MNYFKIVSILGLLCSGVFLKGLQFTELELRNYVEENKYRLFFDKHPQVFGPIFDYSVMLPEEEFIYCSAGITPDCVYGDKHTHVDISDDFYHLLKKIWERTGSGKGITKRIKSQ